MYNQMNGNLIDIPQTVNSKGLGNIGSTTSAAHLNEIIPTILKETSWPLIDVSVL